MTPTQTIYLCCESGIYFIPQRLHSTPQTGVLFMDRQLDLCCESSAFAVRFLSGVQQIILSDNIGDMAEWLGRGLQNLVRRFESACRLFYIDLLLTLPRSSRGLGRRPFTAVTRVRIPYAVQKITVISANSFPVNRNFCLL